MKNARTCFQNISKLCSLFASFPVSSRHISSTNIGTIKSWPDFLELYIARAVLRHVFYSVVLTMFQWWKHKNESAVILCPSRHSSKSHSATLDEVLAYSLNASQMSDEFASQCPPNQIPTVCTGKTASSHHFWCLSVAYDQQAVVIYWLWPWFHWLIQLKIPAAGCTKSTPAGHLQGSAHHPVVEGGYGDWREDFKRKKDSIYQFTMFRYVCCTVEFMKIIRYCRYS